MHNWLTLMYTFKQHNFVNQLCVWCVYSAILYSHENLKASRQANKKHQRRKDKSRRTESLCVSGSKAVIYFTASN